ncbi:MAG: tRNA pseudouridine(13) synthase TruD [Nanoarchaeota archaeon]|nr:tRNA pseudouridine(13) synthase TruD [Nanoarchaeota archaeon]
MKLPYVTGELKGIGGRIKSNLEDFSVEEVGLYEPCGSGEHIYVNVTKRGVTTREVQERLVKLFGLKNSDVSAAGMKDKDAVATQTFSLRTGVSEEEVKEKVERELGVKVNFVKRHKNKLRIGHLLGNRFRIVVRGVCADALERVEEIRKVIEEKGIPNYYGEQRFGIEGGNVQKGIEFIKGSFKVKDRWLRRWYVSCYQSYLCNVYLAERMKRGLFDRILLGDVCKKYDTGGMFVVEEVEKEQKRYGDKEISFTVPVYGLKMRRAEDEALQFEEEIIEGSEVELKELERVGAGGTRRLGRLLVRDLKVEKCGDSELVFSFYLPKGGYATVVMREFVKC